MPDVGSLLEEGKRCESHGVLDRACACYASAAEIAVVSDKLYVIDGHASIDPSVNGSLRSRQHAAHRILRGKAS